RNFVTPSQGFCGLRYWANHCSPATFSSTPKSDVFHFSPKRIQEASIYSKISPDFGTARLIAPITRNGLLIFANKGIQKTFVLSERSLDCRTARLVWPHKVHSQS